MAGVILKYRTHPTVTSFLLSTTYSLANEVPPCLSGDEHPHSSPFPNLLSTLAPYLSGKWFSCIAPAHFQGHTDIVEDVVWKPDSAAELASVGDDFSLLLWDTRAGTGPAQRRLNAHGASDLHTVDWSGLRNDLLATGGCQNSSNLFRP